MKFFQKSDSASARKQWPVRGGGGNALKYVIVLFGKYNVLFFFQAVKRIGRL